MQTAAVREAIGGAGALDWPSWYDRRPRGGTVRSTAFDRLNRGPTSRSEMRTPTASKDELALRLLDLRARAAAFAEGLPVNGVPSQLTQIREELADAELLLRRPTRLNREGVALLIAEAGRRLAALERRPTPASRATG